MFKNSAILTFYALTPIHMGTGQSVSYVDLPVQRERITGYPVLWSSGIKGVLRATAERLQNNSNAAKVIFGPEEKDEYFASSISITDAKILLYPVRSIRGTFAWITCPFVIHRFLEELTSSSSIEKLDFEIPSPTEEQVFIGNNSILSFRSDNEAKVALEEFVFESKEHIILEKLSDYIKKFIAQGEFINNLSQRIALVNDNVFLDFVKYSVEIRTRIRINQLTGTVETGALFSEEFIPSESIFYSLMFFAEPYSYDESIQTSKDVIDFIKKVFEKSNIMQLGGNESIGKGFVRTHFFVPNFNGGPK